MLISVSRSRTGLLVAGTILLAACSAGSSGSDPFDIAPESTDAEAEPVSTEPVVTEPANTDPIATEPSDSDETGFEVAAPRCGDPDGSGGFAEVDCGEPHIAEFVTTVALPVDADFSLEPSDDEALHRACIERNRAFTDDHPGGDYLDADFVIDEAIGQVECWVSNSGNVLSGSIFEVGLAGALGELVFVDTLALGACFEFVGDQFSFVQVVDCSGATGDSTVLQHLGLAPLADGPYPGGEQLEQLAADACLTLLEATIYDVPVAPNFSTLVPGPIGWTVYGQRSANCIGEELASPSADGGASAGLVSNCASLIDGDFVRVDCAEPHGAEFVGSVELSIDVLPDDGVEAADVLMAACRPVVEEFLGTSVSLPGFGVGFESDMGPGEAVVAPADCFVSTGATTVLVGSVAELGAVGVLNGVVLVRELDPGNCFLLGDENFAFGAPVDCGAPDALVHLGSFELEDGPHLGDEAIREIRSERCSAILAESGVAADPATVSGTFPNEEVWRRFDRRLVTCDATPL